MTEVGELFIRTGELFRHRDVSDVSGTGVVAQIVQLGNGNVVLGWLGEHPSTAVWPDVNSVLEVHGHKGATVIYWEDGEVQDRPLTEDETCPGSSGTDTPSTAEFGMPPTGG
jgi:hypothetical protein